MADKTIQQRVADIITGQLNVNAEQVLPTARFVEDLGADSLDLVELIMAFEEEFKNEIGGEIPESAAESLKTVGDVTKFRRPNFRTACVLYRSDSVSSWRYHPIT